MPGTEGSVTFIRSHDKTPRPENHPPPRAGDGEFQPGPKGFANE
jgi:hypothetical protein